ncbi:hypothetical protein [Streptomyces netropsis]|uniref:DUF8017 domain-containing protein n=1 Tax=Streptomyces netropsis TaxID=55404 RepID=A0A7W7PED2_STRNE|nr:hypothetical protein [Streptomyces netropsis]MBB4886939.1 hypothetical protein [Streptomyces netropsis]GGR24316.1 hypothetical protein GCM10010219_31360 [Streptomyces netropsis]
MSWPQNPQDPQQPQGSQPPQPPQQGFGPPPGWTPTAQQPAVSLPPQPPQHQQTPPQPPQAMPPQPPQHQQGMPPQAPQYQQGMPPQPPQPYGAQPPPPPQYQQAPPQPEPPRGGGGNKTMLAVVGGVVALAVIGGGAFFLLRGGDEEKPEAGKGGPQASGAPAQPTQEPTPGNGSASPSGPPPKVAGWQTQTSDEHNYRYDVPAKADKWNVAPQGTAISYTDNGKPVVVMREIASYREGGCSSSANPDSMGEAGKGQLASIGTTGGGKDLDLKENARNWAGNWGTMAYGGLNNKPKIEIQDEKAWKANGIEGWTATAKVTVKNRPSDCVPPTAIVKSIAQKLPDGTFHGWVIYADQGVPDALTEAQIDKIMSTVRPAKD